MYIKRLKHSKRIARYFSSMVNVNVCFHEPMGRKKLTPLVVSVTPLAVTPLVVVWPLKCFKVKIEETIVDMVTISDRRWQSSLAVFPAGAQLGSCSLINTFMN